MNQEKVTDILERYNNEESSLIAILQDIQEQFGYLPRESLLQISHEINVPISRILSVATFFKAFSLIPKGKHPIHVCMGTACHVRGAQLILEKLERELNIKSGETTSDKNFSIDEVRCVGCCGLAPVVMVGEEVYGKVTQTKVPGILKKYKE
ncbi:MAG: NADH-quinone oxidoreductase subunit NuoE [Candidatus Aminicenantes bacterium]|nr:NADH-quinone oxidoreductase subunit NuoE [Candidatus Aminicenantes bacterium]